MFVCVNMVDLLTYSVLLECRRGIWILPDHCFGYGNIIVRQLYISIELSPVCDLFWIFLLTFVW